VLVKPEGPCVYLLIAEHPSHVGFQSLTHSK